MFNQKRIIQQSMYSVFQKGNLFTSEMPDLILKTSIIPKVIVLDDDIIFGKIISKVASKAEIPLTYCKSLEEFSNKINDQFDVAIIDYDLGDVNGIAISQYLESISKDIPILLISQTKKPIVRNWPENIKDFVHKVLGPYLILDSALEIYECDRLKKYIGKKPKYWH